MARALGQETGTSEQAIPRLALALLASSFDCLGRQLADDEVGAPGDTGLDVSHSA